MYVISGELWLILGELLDSQEKGQLITKGLLDELRRTYS
jgi:hypothetical protein